MRSWPIFWIAGTLFRRVSQYIKLIKPKTIFLLGNVAINTVLGDVEKLDKIHGKKIVLDGITYIPTYHPAAAMRFPKIKKKLRIDFKTLLDK